MQQRYHRSITTGHGSGPEKFVEIKLPLGRPTHKPVIVHPQICTIYTARSGNTQFWENLGIEMVYFRWVSFVWDIVDRPDCQWKAQTKAHQSH